MTKQCFHVQREKCVCLTCGLPFGNKCIHLNQNGTFFTIIVFCMPDVRNMLLEEQTKNLEWLIVPKARVCWLVVEAASPSAGWESPGFACEGSVYKGFGSALLPSDSLLSPARAGKPTFHPCCAQKRVRFVAVRENFELP